MDAAETLAGLTALSSEIERAAIVDGAGAVLAAMPASDGQKLAGAAAELLGAAPAGAAHVEVSFAAGSVFVVRDGERVAVATTKPEPASALVLHDLRTLLHETTHA